VYVYTTDVNVRVILKFHDTGRRAVVYLEILRSRGERYVYTHNVPTHTIYIYVC